MVQRICSVDGCERKHYGHGLCNAHYQRTLKGRPVAGPVYPMRPHRLTDDELIAWFWNWFDISQGPAACHNWMRSTSRGGYGQVDMRRIGISSRKSHVVAWVLTHGPVPEGLEVCHHCDNPLCGNANSHLFLGTPKENTADMFAKGRSRWQRHHSGPRSLSSGSNA